MRLSSVRKLLLMLAFGGAVCSVNAQNVIYPGETQPGVAAVTDDNGVYTLSNDLLSVSFIEEGNTLVFGGCEALNLEPGSELFIITLGNGTVVPASQMTLKEVTTEALTADPESYKGSEKFNGQSIKAKFEGTKLNVEWSAILRDGSHYFRTEMKLTPKSEDVAMQSIVAMLYDVKNVEGHAAPQVVGNTRGAVIASDIMFAGLETPMAHNQVLSPNSGLDTFKPNEWTDQSFSWNPGTETPSKILKLKTIAGNKALQTTDIVGTRGFVTFREAGNCNIVFEYAGGSHRLNIVGVDICDPVTGDVVAYDYHTGFSGSAQQNNTYTIKVPETTTYIVRYFVETKTESITSNGHISYSNNIAIPEVIFGEDPNAPKQVKGKAPMRRVLSGTQVNEFNVDDTDTDTWTGTSWTKTGAENVPARIAELGVNVDNVRQMTRKVSFSEPATLSVEFLYSRGNHRLDLCGIDLVDTDGNVAVVDYHEGFSGNQKNDHIYKLEVPAAGEYTLRYFAHNNDNSMNTNGNINLSYTKVFRIYLPAPESQTIQGLWNRNTTLETGKTWTVSAVVGIVAPGQQRRSVCAYVDRERAVAWRSFPLYNSWFELNINRNNDENYTKNMNINQCVDVVAQWEKNLYREYGANIKSFLWDDGWDFYGTWDFNPNFPNGFTEANDVAVAMNSGIGAWLGPVGGYGQSGNYRRSYWSGKGGMQLSNPAYYKIFLDQCTYMINNYNFTAFKFDGISSLFSATGPDPNNEEGAEGIIDIENRVREIRPDIFYVTTVGTWASPFWYNISDVTWRQENDFGKAGNNSNDREQWITYRDRLIYQNYVTNSPLCPTNSIMFHGLLLTEHGEPKYSQEYKHVLNEMRCSFACGTNLVELYTDYKLMNRIKGPDGTKGKLWEDMAECIFWHQNNADVLPDSHWVGGNPWTGSKHEVYGWASWNGVKSTLALRNGDDNAKTFNTTLRQALDIPAHVTGTIRLKSSFKVQDALEGLELDTPIDIDQELTLNLPGSSVFCFDGIEGNTPWPVYPEPVLPGDEIEKNPSITVTPTAVVMTEGETAELKVETKDIPTGANIVWTSSNPLVATVNNGTVTAVAEGTATVTAAYKTAKCEVSVTVNAKEENGVEEVTADSKSEIYDLQGRKVKEPVAPGIYIRGGKVVIL